MTSPVPWILLVIMFCCSPCLARDSDASPPVSPVLDKPRDSTGVNSIRTERYGFAAVLSVGYGSFWFPGTPPTNSNSESWNLVTLGAGFGWHGGKWQLQADIIIARNHDRAPETSFLTGYEETLKGIVPRFRFLLYGPVFGNIGYGYIGKYVTHGESLGPASETFPEFLWGFDVAVFSDRKTRFLIGILKHHINFGTDHSTPAWRQITIHVTAVFSGSRTTSIGR